ncbi:MAG: AEC family transporter [Alphaproteobacteria bacterium]|jgi:hypothetical protein|nr:AEC family transporter [Alphaproteobacteria bacterium]
MLIITAILPVFFVIMTGYLVKKTFAFDETFWKQMDRLIFYVLLPLMIFKTLVEAPISLDMMKVGLVVFIAITVNAALCFLVRALKIWGKIEPVPWPAFTSIFQGTVRVNFYIALSIATIMFGDTGIQILSFILLFLLPSGVVYSICVLQKYGGISDAQCRRGILSVLFKNPVIISLLLGVTTGLFIDELPVLLDETLSIFGRATLPLALLGVGASISFRSLKSLIWPSLIAASLRLIVGPLVGIAVAANFHLSPQETTCIVLVLAGPSAASSMTFATQMGGDTQLMSAILTTQTVLSLGTLSFFVSIMQ